MKLSFQEIKDITLGASYVDEGEKGIRFHRFTKEQEALYKAVNSDFYTKALASAGVKLCFRTDSSRLSMKVHTARGSSRKYFSFDVFKDGEMIDSFNNFADESFFGDYTKTQLPLGEFSFETSLGEGEKEITVHFPWSVKIALESFELDDGSFVVPVKPRYKMVAYGDSITQGYDALYTSRKYSTRLSELLLAEEYNRAIGAELFFPPLAAVGEEMRPDFVTIAYGTNDWFFSTKENLIKNCREFFENIKKSYPDSAVYVITPIWRKDICDVTAAGDFDSACRYIESTAKEFGFEVIEGIDLVPHEEKYFADLFLHPNDAGFDMFAKNLAKVISEK